jgi:hypothetical protein
LLAADDSPPTCCSSCGNMTESIDTFDIFPFRAVANCKCTHKPRTSLSRSLFLQNKLSAVGTCWFLLLFV